MKELEDEFFMCGYLSVVVVKGAEPPVVVSGLRSPGLSAQST